MEEEKLTPAESAEEKKNSSVSADPAASAASEIDDPAGGVLPPIVAKDVIIPMSVYGIGPIYGAVAVGLTALGIFFRNRWIFANGIPSSDFLRYSYIALGILIILAGGKLWLDAVFTVKVDDYIRSNTLCTEGVYAWTRNPIYTAILFICTGALFLSGNVYMYVIPILIWAILTVLLKKTEEPELLRRFGKDFVVYRETVNRVIPKPPGK